MEMETLTDKLICHHCGDTCKDDSISQDEKLFCCTGCLFVYDLLKKNELDGFYEFSDGKGLTPVAFNKNEFEFLDDPKVEEKLLSFKIEEISGATFYIPEIYCSACIWLLENLIRLDSGIRESSVNFVRKELSVQFNNNSTNLRKIVELLVTLGYKPSLNLSSVEEKKKHSDSRDLYIRLGIAGFGFGNIMLFALPEYFSAGFFDPPIKSFLTYLNLVLSIPIMYAAGIYFRLAYSSLRMKYISIEFPISLGIAALFIRSVVDVAMGTGPGYFDSLSGLVFFLLVGRVFQKKTYESMSFDRDFKSYFPLSVLRKNEGNEEFIPIHDIKTGDKLCIRNNELIPTDSVLLSEKAILDYSFVTGETNPVELLNTGKLFAGGKNIGPLIEITALKDYQQSYFTDLWNKGTNKSRSISSSRISDTVARYFTVAILAIGFGAMLWWFPVNSSKAFDIFTAVLIVACPCALALAIPFTYGSVVRIFGKNNFFLKNDSVVEQLTGNNVIIFDKTGTLTDLSRSSMMYFGDEIPAEIIPIVKSTVGQSNHPISRMIFNSLPDSKLSEPDYFSEKPGKGIEAGINGMNVKLGKPELVYENSNVNVGDKEQLRSESKTYLSINGKVYGYFMLRSAFRPNLKDMFIQLRKKFRLILLSGDNSAELDDIMKIAPEDMEFYFDYLPQQKLDKVKDEQSKGSKVMMIGDGLNDSSALTQSDVGIAIAQNTSNFTPGSDAILLSEDLVNLPKFLEFSSKGLITVYLSFGISFLYNIVGLTFAVQGLLTPVLSAILMPISSISIVLFTVLRTRIAGKVAGLK